VEGKEQVRRVKREADSPAKVSFLRFECFSSEQQHTSVFDAEVRAFKWWVKRAS